MTHADEEYLPGLPARPGKPRSRGLTAVMDNGLAFRELHGILEEQSDLIDVAKFGIGSAYVTPRLAEKVSLYREHDVIPYFGGTLFEKFYDNGRFQRYLDYLTANEIDWIEISTGTVEIELSERLELVCDARERGFEVIAEVGRKDTSIIMPPSAWIDEIAAFLDAGVSYVITEGRDSGTAGIYRPSGEIRTGLVADIVSNIDPDRLIFEASSGQAQMFFINLVGPNVNLGNIGPRDLVRLEAQRQGLRSETFHVNGG